MRPAVVLPRPAALWGRARSPHPATAFARSPAAAFSTARPRGTPSPLARHCRTVSDCDIQSASRRWSWSPSGTAGAPRFYATDNGKEAGGLIGATRALATTDWLERNIGLVVPVDGSFHLPTSNRNALDEYNRCHIKNARFFDVELIKDAKSPYPHMLPSQEEFAKHMGELGISDEDHIVIYDSVGMFSSPRVWWMFKVFGHEKVSILDGGLPKWVKEGRPVIDQATSITPKHYKAKKPNASLLLDFPTLKSFIAGTEPKPQIIDARSSTRFYGQSLEPRVGLPSGHIPGSVNVPQSDLVDAATGTLLPKEKLAEIFKSKGVDLDRPIVTTCGSGVSACALIFALDRIGAKSVRVYDGSWSEYADRAEKDGLKIASKGPIRMSLDD